MYVLGHFKASRAQHSSIYTFYIYTMCLRFYKSINYKTSISCNLLVCLLGFTTDYWLWNGFLGKMNWQRWLADRISVLSLHSVLFYYKSPVRWCSVCWFFFFPLQLDKPERVCLGVLPPIQALFFQCLRRQNRKILSTAFPVVGDRIQQEKKSVIDFSVVYVGFWLLQLNNTCRSHYTYSNIRRICHFLIK